MAVENKFKLNVIAASVLVGLSLSAVAAEGPAKPADSKVTTPAKSLAEVAGVVDAKDISIQVEGVNSGIAGSLESLLKKDTAGSFVKAADAYNSAQKTFSQLTPAQRKVITDLNTAAEKTDAAAGVWDSFKNKLSVADNVYDQSLTAMYGEGKQAFTVGSRGVVNADIVADGTVYGGYKKAYGELKGAVKNLNDGIVNVPGTGGALGKLTYNDVGAVKAEAQVLAYSNYINKYIAVKEANLKLDSVRNLVISNIAGALDEIDGTSANQDDKSGPGAKLKEFRDAFTAWNSASAGDKYAKEHNLAVAFKSLVDESGSGLDSGSGASTPAGIKWTDLATAWGKLTDEKTVTGSVASAEADLATAKDFTKTKGDAGSALAAIGKSSVSGVKSIADTTLSPSDYPAPTDLTDAVAKLDAAYRVLLNKDTGASEEELGKLNNLITAASQANKALSGLQADYQAKAGDIASAGASRLQLFLTELPVQQKAFFAAQGEYVKAEKAFNADNTAKNAYDTLYGKDGMSGALGGYRDALVNASEGFGKLLGTNNSPGSVFTDYAAVVAKKDATQADKNKALYKLIGQQKVLVPEKLKVDSKLLELQVAGVPDDVAALIPVEHEALKGLKVLNDDLKTATDNKTKAKAEYTDAVAAYLQADKAWQKSKSADADKALTDAKAKLISLVGIPASDDSGFKKLYVNGTDTNAGFKQFDALSNITTSDTSSVFEKYKAAKNALDNGTAVTTDIQKSRVAVAEGLSQLASLMPLSTAAEQTDFRQKYNDALGQLGAGLADVTKQSEAPDAGKVTHILGSLSPDELARFDVNSGSYKSVIVDVDTSGKIITGVKDNFTGKDLYTGTKDKPFTTTVLDIRALELGNGKLSDTNTITVGEAGSKATPVEVWAKTAGAKHSGDNESSPYVSAEHGPAVKLSGNLRTATAQLDENGKPVEGQVVRGADQIHLQNVNIHNSFTLADRVKMMAEDRAALTSEAADKIKLGQPADGEKGVNAWSKEQAALLNSKYDNLELTGLQIDTKTVNPSFDLDSGNWKKPADILARTAPAEANILLDNLNITLQNDSVDGTSTAIALSGKSNHILANGGVFDAGSVTGTDAQANALDITGTNNRIDFNGSVLKGDIRSSAAGNTVNLTNGSLTGNAAGTGNLELNLDGSTWTGQAGSDSLGVKLSNNSVWNVVHGSSTDSLTLSGSNTLNLVNAEGQGQLGGHGFTGTKSAASLTVKTDLTSDGKGVTSILAGTYSPDNLHSLTNTGRADGYQFGTLHVNGLAEKGKYALSLESSGAEPYTIGGRLADGPEVTTAHDFVSFKTAENRQDKNNPAAVILAQSKADFISLSAPVEMGVYQYAAEQVMDAVNNRTNIYYSSTGKLSNSAATVVSLAAAPVDVANLESDTLTKHMNSVRHGKDSGVWLSYFGGENRNTTADGPEYTLKTNGVMLGVDTLTENNWLAGVAVSSARSDMSVMNSSGDLNSYGAQFYMSRRYDSGVFVDSALQFNHFSNTAKARMINGQQAKADFSGNSYGVEAKVGYAWNSEGFFAEPYVRAAARAFDGEHYALSNGMTVNSNDYKSMLGEVGTDLGYLYDISGGYVKPYLHLAALNEFADGNSVRVNNVSLDNSVKGAAFQAGLGAEVKMTDNLGGYAAFDYTKGDNTERPWQATVGVNYTW